jgi:hypothetical protein
MAKQNLHHFLVALSRFSNLGSDFKKDPDRVMTEAELSAQEKKLVRQGDAKKIRAYLSDDRLAAVLVKFVAP